MSNHIEGALLTAYADSNLTIQETHQVETHLSVCEACKIELAGLRDIKQRLGNMSRLHAPTELLDRLKEIYLTPSLWERIREFFHFTPTWKPASAFALLALLLGLWFVRNRNGEDEVLNIEPLVAAHCRYEAENLVPTGDMMNSDFSAQLAVYYGEKE
jgi:hypothetical protein